MNSRLTKIVLVFFELLAVTLVFSLCIKGMLSPCDKKTFFDFAETSIRCLFITIFAFFYLFSFSRTFENSGVFLLLYILFSVVSEFRIAEDLIKAINTVIIPPRIQVTVFVFSNFMMALSLIGFCTLYETSDQKTVSKFFAGSVAMSAIAAILLPKSPSVATALSVPAIYWVTIILFAVCALSCIILIFTDAPGMNLVRHFASLLFIVSNYANIFYNTFSLNLFATIGFVLACTLIITISKINEVKL